MIQFSCYLTLLIESIVSFIYMEITNHSLNQEILISMQITFSFIYCALHFKHYGNIKAVMDVVTTFILAVVFEIHFQNRTSLSLLRLMLTLQCSITKLSQTNNNKQLAMLYCLFITYATARLLIADIEFVYLSIIITFEIFFFTYRSIKQKDLYQIVEQVTRKDDDEHFYEPLLQNIKIGVCVLNSNVQLKYANSRALKILNAEDLNSACTQLHQFLQLGLQQNDKFDQEQLLVRRRTQRGQSQKTDPSLINRMIDHVNKRLDTKSEKLQDLSVRFRKVTNIKDFKSLFLSFYENQTRKYKRQYARNNGLKINITQQNRKQKTYLFQFYQAHDNKLQPQYIIQIIDNTEKEQLQNFIQQYQFKTFHFNSFSHELRTPLNCSLQMLQALGEVVDCQINKQYLKPAIISNKLLMHQINDLLDYGSFCLNDFKIFTSKFYITEIFNILREYYEDACEMKKLKLTFEIDHNLDHSQIESDFERILQLLVNLINNSLKFTRQNDCIIVKASEQQNQMSSFIKFSVYDTGIGISKQGLMSIKNALITDNQDVFTQINNIATKYVGLGLIIGSMVAKELSFNETPLLKIKSKENLFFQVSFKVKNQIVRLVRDDCPLPLERQLSDSIYPLTISVTSKSICQQMPNSQQTFLAMRHYNLAQILICDDVSFNLMSLQMLIQNLGHKCDLAYDGREAIQLCEYRNQENLPQYKLILMDIEMPVINGYDTAKSILDSCGETNIVMCSAYDSSSNIEQSKEAGMRDFITKPVRLDHLKRILNTYL